MKKYIFETVIFDLDGVLTRTASVHAKAWKIVFDDLLKKRGAKGGVSFKEFTIDEDYPVYVDGKPRNVGIKNFLESRNIKIPVGNFEDTVDKETIYGVGNKKNMMFREVLKEKGVDVYLPTIEFVKSLKKSGIRVGVASSSKNCRYILQCAGIEDLFETRVDGVISAQLGLKGKPEGDIFVKACRNLGSEPAASVVIEDAISGVQAGRNGGFGLVIGVARQSNEYDLIENGADVAVKDPSDISIDCIEQWFHRKPKVLFELWEKKGGMSDLKRELTGCGQKVIFNPYHARGGKQALFNGKKLIFFLDYDGTLTPIVERPELAVMSEEMRSVVKKLSEDQTVAIVSGRMRDDVENLVNIKGLLYAGSHGFDILGDEFKMIHPGVNEIIPIVSKVIERVKGELGGIKGVLIEEKKFSVAVHYRLADEKYLSAIKVSVDKAVEAHKELRLMSGKKVFEIMPSIEWNKGMAINWIMEALKLSWSESSVVYIGDDVTDEDAFRVVRTRGTGILVSDHARRSAADFQLNSVNEVKKLFENVIGNSQEKD